MRFLLVCFYLFTSAVFAQNPSMIVKVIDLHYVQANALIPQLKPLLKPQETLTGNKYTLIVNVSPETLTLIRPIIHKLDSPPVVFEVSLHQGSEDWAQQEASGGSEYTTSPTTESSHSQSVRVMNGESAFVSMGSDRPVLGAVSGGELPGVSFQRQHDKQGFYILPLLQGQEVRITFRRMFQQANRINEQTSDNQNTETTTLVPLNKWIKVSSAGAGTINDQPKSTSYEAGNSFSDEASLFIKVRVVQ